jgi:hypothetical protein
VEEAAALAAAPAGAARGSVTTGEETDEGAPGAMEPAEEVGEGEPTAEEEEEEVGTDG